MAFFNTEIPYVFNMIQTIINFGIGLNNKILATVHERPIQSLEQSHIKNFKLYADYFAMQQNYLMPLDFNCL